MKQQEPQCEDGLFSKAAEAGNVATKYHCHLEVEKNGDLVVVRFGAYLVLDDLTVNEISDELLGVVDRPDCHRLLLDLCGVTQLSSAMLARLVTLHRKMQSKGEKLMLCGISSHLRSIFATTRLDRLFDILDTESGTVT
jgi:anti-anti-sigma factor